MVCMANTDTVMKFIALLEAEGCNTELDLDAGTVRVSDSDGKQVYWAIQKGAKNAFWIVRCTNSDRIKFDNHTAETFTN